MNNFIWKITFGGLAILCTIAGTMPPFDLANYINLILVGAHISVLLHIAKEDLKEIQISKIKTKFAVLDKSDMEWEVETLGDDENGY